MKKVQIIMSALLLLFLAACNNGGKETAKESAGNVNEKSSQSFQTLTFDKEVLSKLNDVKGDFLYGKRWEDKNGDNVLVFTLKEVFKKWKDAEYDDMGDFTRYLKVYHFASEDKENYKLMRLIQDFNQNPCSSPPFLLEGDFYKESISITDLDGDNLGEATFMYYFNCASEINPRTVKLMLLEDGKKYAIRGNQYIKQFYPESGKKEFGKEFSSAPAEFKEHASKVWEKFCKSNPNV